MAQQSKIKHRRQKSIFEVLKMHGEGESFFLPVIPLISGGYKWSILDFYILIRKLPPVHTPKLSYKYLEYQGSYDLGFTATELPINTPAFLAGIQHLPWSPEPGWGRTADSKTSQSKSVS